MNFRQASTREVALVLHGLRSIMVRDLEDLRQAIVNDAETELSRRGCRLAEDGEVIDESELVQPPVRS